MTETDEQGFTEANEPAQAPAAPERPPVELRPALEAVLMIADEPLEHLVLAQAVGHPPAEVEQALRDLAAEYTEQGRGFELRELAGGWRFYTREEYADVVAAFVLEGQQAKLSQAALETLAVVAYRQPISRSRISAIRGVNVDGVVRTLVTRGLITELGHDGESGAILYGTTNYFLERMGLSGLGELPELAPMLPDLADLDSELERVAQETAEREAVPEDPAPADADATAPTEGGDRG
ncbi:SMC-Scp complex subunit ScpB [Aeromicrobium duanguangcaii]|uniref:SMC-Scp complex subunit ScpB n=1 Tax=Aeromicrobium duanguangcaii TaxID=2968086 RepID=A0ABY5KBX0_9ACTN|nr:SMC-Scp complex subunit ScpB [Aeromicrobium duanguangcaii]UUI67528.1 SMC-Scp complex subunit ScpB [Aeromicrobium duanguangcaii]